MNEAQGWVGFDLDGTLAYYDTWRGIDHIGVPIWPMWTVVYTWLNHGYECRLFTARISGEDQRPARKAIQRWYDLHDLPNLTITNVKDFGMLCLYDDRAVAVRPNTGQLIGGVYHREATAFAPYRVRPEKG